MAMGADEHKIGAPCPRGQTTAQRGYGAAWRQM